MTIQTDKPVTTTIYLRYPSWSEGVKVNVNGKKVSVKQKPGSYIAVTRQWKDGDRIEANYPMSLQLKPLLIILKRELCYTDRWY